MNCDVAARMLGHGANIEHTRTHHILHSRNCILHPPSKFDFWTSRELYSPAAPPYKCSKFSPAPPDQLFNTIQHHIFTVFFLRLRRMWGGLGMKSFPRSRIPNFPPTASKTMGQSTRAQKLRIFPAAGAFLTKTRRRESTSRIFPPEANTAPTLKPSVLPVRAAHIQILACTTFHGIHLKQWFKYRLQNSLPTGS
ncbi:hypothetical protein C8R43DRAFT_941108 [Mycena crocata]|nr:hypothetical protein C8R43DRAFT_941108 [Mycena crocata]